MRKWCIWLLILSTTTLLLTACGQKDNVYKIGAEGGLIQSEAHGVSLAVAPNSVEGTTKIGIEPMNEPDALGDDQVTDFYTFEGLESVNGTVTCTMKVTEPLSGDTYAAVTMPAYVYSEGRTADTIMYIPCIVKDDNVSFSIPVDDIETKENNQSLMDLFGGTSYADNGTPTIRAAIISAQSTSTTSNGKFKIVAGSTVRQIDKETVEQYLNYLYGFYKDDLGFKKLEDYGRWPMTVTIRGLYPIIEDSSTEVAGYFYDVGPSEWIVINKDLLSQFDEIQRTLIHEFFHFVQSRYGSYTWLDEASAVWVEERYKPNSGYIPTLYKKFGGESSQIMDGPTNTKNRSARNHGYGSAAFIKYLVDHRNAAGSLVTVYEAQPSDEVAALNLIAPVETWNNDFYIKLLTRKVYGGTVPNLVTYKKESKTIGLDVKKDSNPDIPPVTEGVEIPPYGARAIYVEIEYGDIEKLNKNLSVVATASAPNVTLNWVIAKGSDMSALASASGEVSLGGLSELAKKKHILGLLVTNQSKTAVKSDVDFKIKNIPPLEELVGDWTNVTSYFEDIWLHSEIQAIINNPPEKDEPVSDELADEFGEGCEMITADIIYEMFKELAEMEGKTFPSKLTITQTSETTGVFNLAMDTGDGMDDSGLPAEFEYIDGVMKAEMTQAEEGAESKITLEFTFMYDSDDNIDANGFMDLAWGSEGKTALKFHILINGKRPRPADSK